MLCSCFPLAIYFTFGCVCMSMLLTLLLRPQVHSLRLRLYSCPATSFISTIFFFYIPYICISIWYLVFVFLFLTSLCMTDSRLRQFRCPEVIQSQMGARPISRAVTGETVPSNIAQCSLFSKQFIPFPLNLYLPPPPQRKYLPPVISISGPSCFFQNYPGLRWVPPSST